MSLLSFIAIGVGLLAMAALAFGLPDRWFCALLALACMLGAADAAYSELTAWAVVFLASGVLLCGASAHAVLTDSRERRDQR